MSPQPEIIIERDHILRARAYGAVCIKGKIEGRAAYPDQLVLKKGREFYWIEFKSLTGSLQPDQIEMHIALRKRGHKIYICNTKRHSKEILEEEFT